MNLNTTVIVTGGGSGIGAAIAIAFARDGANVAIVGRTESKLIDIAEKCASAGKEALIIKADVSKKEDAERIIQTTVDKFGRLDILVNNAGITKPGSIFVGDILEAYDEIMSTNLRAAIHLTTLAAPHLVKTKGNIVNISSVSACSTNMRAVVPDLFTYSISKAALNQFTRCSAVELAPHGVRVNSVSPGPVMTDILTNCATELRVGNDWDFYKKFTLLDRLGEPQEIADLVLFIASEKARSITGADYISDNGTLIKH